MKMLLLAPRFASLSIPVSLTAGVIVGTFLLASTTFGQSPGYQYQGPPPSSPYASGGPSSYQQPAYQQPSYQQPAYQSPYQQRSYSASKPAVPKPQKPAYSPGAYDQVQPHSYPAGSLNPSPKRQPQGPVYQYAPKPGSSHAVSHPSSNSLAQEVADLKASQRRLDRRVDALEAGNGGGGGYVPGTPSGSYRKHTVEYGDSLSDLASHYGVSVSQLKTLNRLSSNQLTEGQVLKIPARSSSKNTDTFVSSRGNGSHVVQRGESLSKIASQYGLSSSALQKANGIRNPDLLVVGQKLVLPGRAGKGNGGGSTVRKTTIASSSKKDSGHYVGKSSKPKPTTLYADNSSASSGGMGSGAIPAPTGSRGITSYRVEPGDSIESVARMFGTSSSEIQRKNKLPSAKLPPPGDEIVVPQPGSVSS